MKKYILLLLNIVYINSFSQYCTPSFPSGVEPICRVIFHTIDNNSSCATSASAYEDFSGIQTTLIAGQTYSIFVYGNTNGNYTNHINVYIDWNNNGTLNDAGESYYLGTITNCSNCYVSGNINVPAGISGPRRMRVMKKYNMQADPCNNTGYGQAEDYTLFIINNSQTAQFRFHNYPATAGTQTAFNHIRLQSTTPTFTVSSTHFATYNAIQIELNTKPDFTGTAYVQTFMGTYTSGVPYDLTCNNLSPALPAIEATYYVRGRVSNTGGATWSSWSNQLWVYTYGDTYWGWHVTAKPQFEVGQKISTPYGNHLDFHDNGTSSVTHDDYMYLPVGRTITRLNTAADQALTEGTTYYSGASYDCITVGYYNPDWFTSQQDYHGFRFQNAALPKSAQILSALFRPYAHNGSGCGATPNTTNELRLDIKGVAQDNCNAWANTSDPQTGQPRYRVRGTESVIWNVPQGSSQQWSTGLLVETAPDISNIIQEIVNRPGYQAGNAIGIIVDHNSTSGPYWRYFATMRSNTAYRASIEATFTNYENSIRFPNVALNQYSNASHWDKLIVNHSISCSGCAAVYEVRDAQTNNLIASGSGTSIDLNNSTADSVYVVVRLSRTDNSPVVMDLTLTVVQNVNPPLADFVASSTSICAGQCINFTDLSSNNPTSWQWTFNGGTPASSTQQHPSNICFHTPGTYTIELTVSNPDGTDTETKVNYITVHPNPSVNLGNDTTICSGNNIVLNAGAGYINYSWDPPAGNTSTITVNTSGTYSVTVTDANNCQGSDVIVVHVLNSVNTTITSPTNYCSNGANVILTAVDQGGSWWGAGILNSSTGLFSPSAAGPGVHTIYYGIAGSCGDTSNVQITVFQAPIVNLGNDTTICSGNNIVLNAGAGYINYSWDPPAGNTSTITVNTSGTYSVTVTDSNNCQGSDAIVVTVVQQADATILTTQTEFCQNHSSVQFTAAQSGGVWIGAGMNSTGLFQPSEAGVGQHTITYTIPGPCGDTDAKIITVHPVPSINIAYSDESCIDAGDGWAVVLITQGTAPYSILWNTGSTNDTIRQLYPGIYSVMVTDNNQCQTTAQVVVGGGTEPCRPSHVFIPNVFSPNGDGENDVLQVYGTGIRDMEFVVYNRWGQKVFETTSQQEGWDGTYKGKIVPSDVYVYFLRYTLTNSNEIHKMNGTITLVR